MPDITMCKGGECPQKETCWRYTAKPDEYWQSFFSEVPFDRDGECNHYYPDWRFDKEGR